MTNLYAQEEFVNLTKGHRFGSSDPYETFTDDKGELFRAMQSEYGRCTGKVYVDTDKGAKPVGWVFVSRQPYDDCDETYLREVWVTVHDAPPTRTTEYHYA